MSFLIEPFMIHYSFAQESCSDSLVLIDSQNREALIESKSNKNFFSRLGNDLYSQVKAPFSMDSNDMLWVSGGVIGTIGLYSVDQPIDHFAKHLKRSSSFISSVSSSITDFGGTYGYIGVGLFSLFSVISGREYEEETSMLLGEAMITEGLWTRLGKLVTGRERPSAAYFHANYHQRGTWSGPVKQFRHQPGAMLSSYDAFPSGHTATTFAIAAVVSERYSNNIVVPIISYSLATLIGLSRMTEHAHWASDVFAGACVGYLCGHSVVSYNKPKQQSSSHEPDDFSSSTRSIQSQFYLTAIDGTPSIGLAVTF